MTLVAPACRLLRVVHQIDLEKPSDARRDRDGAPLPDANTGWTVCGQPMLTVDVWLPVPPDADIPLCGGCAAGRAPETVALFEETTDAD